MMCVCSQTRAAAQVAAVKGQAPRRRALSRRSRAALTTSAAMGRSMRLFERMCIGFIVCADRCFSVFLRFLGPVLVVLANGLIGLVTYMCT